METFRLLAICVASWFLCCEGCAEQPTLVSSAAEDREPPAGASALGFRHLIFVVRPTLNDISFNDDDVAALYNGEWYANPPPQKRLYGDNEGSLRLQQGGDLASANHGLTSGTLPLLSGESGFYVEVTYRVDHATRNDWPAVWLMPTEHDALKRDHLDEMPAGFEQWMELDIDEGGFGPGLTGTVHSWAGVWPNYRQVQNPNNISTSVLNRTKWHTYGASFDAENLEVAWWLDDVRQMKAGAPFVPIIATRHHYYLLLSANSHDGVSEYGMTISRIRAFGP